MPFITGIKVLHRGMELGTLRPELFDGALQFLDGIRLPWIDRGEERETFRVTLDDRANKVVCERRSMGGRLRIPREQNPKDLLLRKLHGELVGTALMHLAAEIPRRALAVWTHAAIEPFGQWQMNM